MPQFVLTLLRLESWQGKILSSITARLAKEGSMPLTSPKARREIHFRVIDMRAYARDDGLYDIEARLIDRKPFAFERLHMSEVMPAGTPLHDLWLRVTVDDNFVVHAVEASSDVTPFPVCRGAEATLQSIVGERIARGWSSRVKELLRGATSCTHLMEMLIPLGTTALQGINAVRADRITRQASLVNKIDSCYAYGRSREVVQQFWPEHHRPEGQE